MQIRTRWKVKSKSPERRGGAAETVLTVYRWGPYISIDTRSPTAESQPYLHKMIQTCRAGKREPDGRKGEKEAYLIDGDLKGLRKKSGVEKESEGTNRSKMMEHLNNL